MTQILLIENDQSLSSILRLNITKTLGSDVLLKDSTADAISLIELLGELRLIITRDSIGADTIAQNLSKYLVANSMNIPILVFGKEAAGCKNFVNIDSAQDWQKIINSAGVLLGTNIQKISTEVEKFVAVDINYFLNITSTSMGCDVYIKVKKGENDFQYLKRLHSTDQFERDDIVRYIKTGLKEFYISKDHYSDFVNYVTVQLSLKLEDATLKTEDRIQLNSESYEINLDRVSAMEIDSFTMELVDESIKSMQTSLKDEKALGSFLAQLNANKLSYAYSHSYLSCLILHTIVAQFSWNSDAIKDKITYLAYFHDISLKDEKLLKIHSDLDVRKGMLSSEETQLVLNHANLSAEILEKFSSAPFDVGAIIREHHGSKNGKGFSEGRSISISPLAMMFIVVEDFVTYFLEIPGTPTNSQLSAILDDLSEIYTKSTYAQTLDALKKIIIPSK